MTMPISPALKARLAALSEDEKQMLLCRALLLEDIFKRMKGVSQAVDNAAKSHRRPLQKRSK